MRLSPARNGSRSTHSPRSTDCAHDPGPPLAESLRPPGPVQLDLSQHIAEGRTVLEARGEVDVMTALQLSHQLDAILRGTDGDVIVDLSRATFLDSAGLHVLMNAARRLTRQDRRLQVACSPGEVRQVIELARLSDALNLTDAESGR
jgi:anti-sigma B factor antagonist